MSGTVAVTGATGHVGDGLVRALRTRGVPVRAIGRSAERLSGLVATGAEAAVGSLDDTAFLTKTFEGSAAVFAMIPPHYTAADNRAHQRAIAESLARAVEASGVKRVVTLSSVGADLASGNGPIAGLHILEKRLEQIAGLHVLHLRPTYFMENDLSSIGLIKSAGILGSPLKADLAFPLIATRDIAAAAADNLAAPTFEGRSFRELLGPREYTRRESARILGEATGKPELPYVEFSFEDTRGALLGAGLSPSLADDFLEMYAAFNGGRIRSLQGRTAATTTPTTLEEFARTVFAPAFRS
jgi:uncharacterized protein YbjT (DUF2867 family)